MYFLYSWITCSICIWYVCLLSLISKITLNDLFVLFLKSDFNFFLSIDDISHNKIATQSHTNNNNDASRAVDGNTETCMQSRAIGPNSPDTTVWWKVDLGEINNIYTINIQFRNHDDYGLCFFFYHLCIRYNITLYNTGSIPVWNQVYTNEIY